MSNTDDANRDQTDLARPEDFEGPTQHNEPGHHQWVGPDGALAEPLGADTSPTQHPRIAMQKDGENYRCPSCGSVVKVDAQTSSSGQAWCDGINQGAD